MDNKIKSFKEICKISRELKKKNKKTVFVHGIFDILHKGHVYLLTEAKKLGDILIVGVDHDDNARKLKGAGRPINDHGSRMFVISNIEHVDYVFLIPSFINEKSDSFFDKIYKPLKPNIVATSVKSGKFGKNKRKSAEKINAEFVDISSYIYDKNTTKTLEILGLE